MLEKKDIVNFLFVISFPVFGVGCYVGGFSAVGPILSILPLILIIVFYVLDSLYQRSLNFRPNLLYFLINVFLLLFAYSVQVGLENIPSMSKPTGWGRMLQIIIPYNAFVPMFLYNGKDTQKVIRLTFVGLGILLLINIVGFFGLGLTNAVHSIEGRVNFPFIDSLYSGSAMLVVISLMLIYYMKQSKGQPINFTKMMLYLVLCIALILMINSRLHTMVFLVTIVLFLLGTGIKSRFLFFASIFFVPLLLEFALRVYEILSLPAMEAILTRVSKEDVTTFNGRAQLWTAAIDWLLNDQTGLWFGNGYKGHVVLHLLDVEAIRWGTPTIHLHLHSTAFELLTTVGVFGYGLFLIIMYKIFLYIREAYTNRLPEGVFMPVIFFLIWALQVDLLVYMSSVGNLFLVLLWAMATVGLNRRKAETETLVAAPMEIQGSLPHFN